jgi:hypothetical protein
MADGGEDELGLEERVGLERARGELAPGPDVAFGERCGL